MRRDQTKYLKEKPHSKIHIQFSEDTSTNAAEWLMSTTSNLHLKSHNETNLFTGVKATTFNAIKGFYVLRHNCQSYMAALMCKCQVILRIFQKLE